VQAVTQKTWIPPRLVKWLPVVALALVLVAVTALSFLPGNRIDLASASIVFAVFLLASSFVALVVGLLDGVELAYARVLFSASLRSGLPLFVFLLIDYCFIADFIKTNIGVIAACYALTLISCVFGSLYSLDRSSDGGESRAVRPL